MKSTGMVRQLDTLGRIVIPVELRRTMDLSIKDYYTQRRFETAAKMLAQDYTIARISQVLHFSDDSSFCKAFKKYYHTTPAKYRELLSGSSDQLSI